jgi:hypothetical protein
MADWIDTLGEAIQRVTESFMDSDRPRQLVGTIFAGLTAFLLLGTVIALWLGTKLDPVGYYFLIPIVLVSASIAIYCFVTDRHD